MVEDEPLLLKEEFPEMIKIYVSTDEEGYVTGYGKAEYGEITEDPKNSHLVQIEKDSIFFSSDFSHFKLSGHMLILDEKKKEEEIKKAEKRKEKDKEKMIKAEKRQNATKLILGKIGESFLKNDEVSEEEKQIFKDLYDDWIAGENYKVGDKMTYADSVFEVIQPHTSQSDWKPNEVPSLYKPIYQKETSSGEEVVPDFVQPTGTHDAYQKGDKVVYNDDVYESLIDNNVWAPDDYAAAWQKLE